MTRYPVTYELDDHNEAIVTHYYCSDECRAIDRRQHLTRRPISDAYDPVTINGLRCEHCDRPLDGTPFHPDVDAVDPYGRL